MMVIHQIKSILRRKSLRQGLSVLFDQGLMSLTNFLTGVLVARANDRADYGCFVLGFTILRFSLGVTHSLVAVPFTIESPHRTVDRRSYLGSTILHQLLLTVVLSVSFLSMAFVFSSRDQSLSELMAFLAIFAGPFFLWEFARLVMISLQKYYFSVFLGSAANIACLTCFYFLSRHELLSVRNAFVAMTVIWSVPMLVALVDLGRRAKPDFNGIGSVFLLHWKTGKWLVARSFANFGVVAIWPILITALAGTSATAQYGACMSLAGLLNPFFFGLTNYVRSKGAHVLAKDPGRFHAILLVTETVTLLIVVPFLAGFIFFRKELLYFCYGTKYLDVPALLVICALGNALCMISAQVEVLLDVSKKTFYTFLGRMTGLLVSLGCGIPLILLFGVYGAAWAFLSARLVTLILWAGMTGKVAN